MFNEVKNCVICLSEQKDWSVLFHLNSEQYLVKCNKCGLIFNNKRRIDLNEVYSDNYFWADEKKSEGGYYDYLSLEKALNKNYKFAFDFVLSKTKSRDQSVNVLDIGCGCGFFLKQFRDKKKFKLNGIELNKKSCQIANESGINVINMDFGNFNPEEKFDFIFSFEVIEHVLNPFEMAEKIYKISKPGSYVLMTTPDSGNILFNILRKKWPAIHPSSHNYYFSKKTIKTLMEKAGFEVFKIKEKQLLWRDVKQLRKRMVELFRWSSFIVNPFKNFDNKIIPFLSGGSLEIIARKGSD